MRQNLQVHSGNRIVVEADGKMIGLCQNLRCDDNYGHERASGIGDIHVQEFVPGQANHSLSIQTMHLFRKNMVDNGIVPQNGDDVLKGMEFDIVIYSKDTNQALTKYIGVKYDSGSVDISAHRIVTRSGQFLARDKQTTGF